ncbi:hypothetical protein M378DRAFT_161393 [Amanita muscaria Koide BX008]|uniref:Uncharacterized protein n=1 Tax=Amanita muscaria (strain Koide BX008) TaxID=946122 RepID=A0A0C2WWE5_AMAMK|nr:hypothetical protein M378DRAFT_161393 [Amanita muscaria Koide BX008]
MARERVDGKIKSKCALIGETSSNWPADIVATRSIPTVNVADQCLWSIAVSATSSYGRNTALGSSEFRTSDISPT